VIAVERVPVSDRSSLRSLLVPSVTVGLVGAYPAEQLRAAEKSDTREHAAEAGQSVVSGLYSIGNAERRVGISRFLLIVRVGATA